MECGVLQPDELGDTLPAHHVMSGGPAGVLASQVVHHALVRLATGLPPPMDDDSADSGRLAGFEIAARRVANSLLEVIGEICCPSRGAGTDQEPASHPQHGGGTQNRTSARPLGGPGSDRNHVFTSFLRGAGSHHSAEHGVAAASVTPQTGFS